MSLRFFIAVVILGAFLPSLGAGLYHHLRMQHLFVKVVLPLKGHVYGTISQTIILVRRDATVHYFYRDTRGDTIKMWNETRFKIKEQERTRA